MLLKKIDGANTRICWDGHAINILGRTDDFVAPANVSELWNQFEQGVVCKANIPIYTRDRIPCECKIKWQDILLNDRKLKERTKK